LNHPRWGIPEAEVWISGSSSAYVYIESIFGGNIINQYTYEGSLNVPGVITFTGPKFKKSEKGNISFWILTLIAKNGAYNPWKNNPSVGLWPVTYPNATIEYTGQ
jgi:hypothetical protein